MPDWEGDIRLLYPSKYFKAPDLRGREVTLTITRVREEDMEGGQGKKTKPMVFFEETRTKASETGKEEKRLALNPTNRDTIGQLYGWLAREWRGKRITLYVSETDSPKGRTDCIRIRPTIPPDQKNGGAVAETTETPEASAVTEAKKE
jgi:hypothetical protein